MKSTTFQYVLLIIFGFLGIFGVLIFSGLIPIGGDGETYEGQVTMWGFIPQTNMSVFVSDFNAENGGVLSLKYVYKDRQSFESEFVNALARGEGPDLVMFPNNLIVSQGDKIMTLPFATYPERTFKDTFAEAGEIFLSKDGVVAIPLYADPLVMYWNRDLFTNAEVVSYPKTWVEFLSLSNKLTKKDDKGNIFQSAVAMGSYRNISNAKEILSTLFLQVGDNIISRRVAPGEIVESFASTLGSVSGGSEAALNFFIEFSNPAKSAYSWNPSLSESKKLFAEGKLAVYFGKASEYAGIRANNPHLNFDVAVMPQRDDSNKKITHADIMGISVVKSSKKPNTSIKAMYSLTNNKYGKRLADLASLPSLRRDILSSAETDPVKSVFKSSAIISKAWYDPNSSASDSILRTVVEAVNSGRQTSSAAIRDAQIKLLEYVK